MGASEGISTNSAPGISPNAPPTLLSEYVGEMCFATVVLNSFHVVVDQLN